MWCNAGSPSSGVLHQLKLASKHRYKYDIKRLNRQQSHFRRRRMAEALASSSSRNFWNEINNVNRSFSQRPSHAPVADGIRREADIANVFSSKISSLLSSANLESNDSLLHQLMDHLTSEDLSSVTVSSSCVRSAFKLLKPHKADSTSLLCDHLIFALPAIEGSVSDLFTCILCHVGICQLLFVTAF